MGRKRKSDVLGKIRTGALAILTGFVLIATFRPSVTRVFAGTDGQVGPHSEGVSNVTLHIPQRIWSKSEVVDQCLYTNYKQRGFIINIAERSSNGAVHFYSDSSPERPLNVIYPEPSEDRELFSPIACISRRSLVLERNSQQDEPGSLGVLVEPI